MIVDSSALVAIIGYEPEAAALLRAMDADRHPRVGSPTLVETAIVLGRRGPAGRKDLDRLMSTFGLETVVFTARHAERAAQAHEVYGRGSGHRARLNYGDCMAYAVASIENEPLLFKGDDFTHTDIRPALTL